MILVITGTGDGRELVQELTEKGYKMIVSVTTEYGKSLIEGDNCGINTMPLDTDGLVALIRLDNIQCIVDASHPYAVNVSRNAMDAARKAGIDYIRYDRPSALLPAYDKLFLVNSYEEAAEKAGQLGHHIFLTTGSRNLKVFKQHNALSGHRLTARVLPLVKSIEECLAAGFTSKDIIAVQGPFSHEFNKAMFAEYSAEVVVMKNSGSIGGTDTKVTAAMELGLSILVIDRPQLDYGKVVQSFAAVMECLQEVRVR
ncbi:MAG: precorrin-6x reductase [Firmicutes bacterium]|nr:precorrin-6x reductase [Bacillota bacterium]